MLTILEAAAEKKISPTSIRRAVKEFRLPAVRKGNMWFISRQDLEAWQPIGHRPKKNPPA